MITEDYVSFETAKLLHDKGFNLAEFYGKWAIDYDNVPLADEDEEDPDGKIIVAEWQYPLITLQMAMKWLREEKHYYIQVMLDGWACGGHSGYYVVIQKTDSDFEMMLQDAVDEVFYQTYEEACEAAIKYCLEKLIQI